MTKTILKEIYSRNLRLTKTLYGRPMPITAMRLTRCDMVSEKAKDKYGKRLEIKRA